MAAELKAGRESYHKALREQESRFVEKKRELEAEKRSLEQNLQRVHRERSDEKKARRRTAEEVVRLRGELHSLCA